MNVPRAQNNHHQACAACKHQRRKCLPDCILAPYFPANNQDQFLKAHRLFGVSNILKSLRKVDPLKKNDLMKSMLYEATIRANHPVGGCAGVVQHLQHQINQVMAELYFVNSQLMACRAHAQVIAQMQLNEARMGLIGVNAEGAKMGLIDVNRDGAGLIDDNGDGVKMIDVNGDGAGLVDNGDGVKMIDVNGEGVKMGFIDVNGEAEGIKMNDVNADGLKMGVVDLNDEGEGRDGIGLIGWVAQDIVDGGAGGGGEGSPSSFSHGQQTQSFLSLFDEAPLQTTVEECKVTKEEPELEDVPEETGNENTQEPEQRDDASNV